MGVNGLWELLAPVGRRVSVETVSGKKLAIDASIWMIQFMKAMRDEIGEMTKNAHLLGFFRRICKLLFLRTKPVFVFDGGTPLLKRRTVIARRRQRENAQAKVRKTAEKLLLNRLKEIKLMELASGAGNPSPSEDANCESFPPDESSRGDIPANAKAVSVTPAHQNIDELLSKSLAAEATGAFLGTLPSHAGMLSLSDEEGDVGDDNEEMILPAMDGKIDASVLAALPPSMQLDLLMQMRERAMAENRQKYEHVKTAPTEFSELQIESYLKTVAFRREIDDAQKAAAAGRGVGGVRASRIASETNREFIFSSSFSGDKSHLIHAAAAGHPSPDSVPARPVMPPITGESSSTDATPRKMMACRNSITGSDGVNGDERGVRPSGFRAKCQNLSPSKETDTGDSPARVNRSANVETAESSRPHHRDPDPPVFDAEISIELTLGKEDDDDDVFSRLVGGSGEESEFSWEEEEEREESQGGVLEEDADVREAIRRSLEENLPRPEADHDESPTPDVEKSPESHEDESPEMPRNTNERQEQRAEEDEHDESRTPDGEKSMESDENEGPEVPKNASEQQQQEQQPEEEDFDDVREERAGFSLEDVRRERADLADEQRRMERNAETASGEMFDECRELLQMFGLPYIVAPMEAEAQCAHMELNGLVDGVVTDDSDVFLFGGRSVYKNIFDDRRYVETYLMEDVEAELGLSREKLIRMALLLGSDYTEGVSGIGIVNALEVIAAFPDEDNGLARFREWVESPDPSIIPAATTAAAAAPAAADAELLFMEKHRKVSKNWHIPPTFPSDAVMSAYASPRVDTSVEPFSWGRPDLPLLRGLCMDKFGWTRQKSDGALLPVLKEYNMSQTQLRLDAFYTFNERFAKIRSVRMRKAVKGITVKEGAARRKKRVRPDDDDDDIFT